MTKAKEEVKVEVEEIIPDYTTWNLFQKMNEARLRLAMTCTKKSGYNGFAKFNYFELKDFIPQILRIFNELGLIGVQGHVNAAIDKDTGVELAPEMYTLTIFNADKPDDKPLIFTKKRASAEQKGQLPIQALGSESTYMRRYLWMDAMEIVEDDSTDATIGSKGSEPAEQKERLITPAQMKIIQSSGVDIQAMLQYFNVPEIGKLTAAQASEVIARKRLEPHE